VQRPRAEHEEKPHGSHALAPDKDAGRQGREDHRRERAVEPDEGGPAGVAAGALGQEVPGGVKEAGDQHQAQGEGGHGLAPFARPRLRDGRAVVTTLRPLAPPALFAFDAFSAGYETRHGAGAKHSKAVRDLSTRRAWAKETNFLFASTVTRTPRAYTLRP